MGIEQVAKAGHKRSSIRLILEKASDDQRGLDKQHVVFQTLLVVVSEVVSEATPGGPGQCIVIQSLTVQIKRRIRVPGNPSPTA